MRIALLCLLVRLFATSALAQSSPQRVEKAFQEGGQIQMRLGSGDYELRAGRADRILIEWTAKNDADAAKVKTKLNIVEGSAKIQVSGPHNDFHAVIEVPPETNLVIHLAAGDIRVGGIVGNKDISSHVGDLDINVGNANDYGRVEASVNVGDLNAVAFGTSKDGFFRSFRYQGKGRYVLRAHVGVGDLNLH